MDVDVDDFAVMADEKSESESELILSPSPVATFNSHSPMSGDELTMMLSLDLTSTTLALALALEEDDAADTAAADGLPMIPKRRRNAGGHVAPSTPSLVADTAGRRRLWSISLSGGRIIPNADARVLFVAKKL